MEARADDGRLLVITYGHVADTMAAIPALRSLRATHPQARIDVLALRPAAELLAACPYVTEVLDWHDFRRKGERGARLEKGALISALALRLRLRQYTAVLVLHRSNRAMRTLARLVGAPTVAGVSAGGEGYSHAVPPSAEVHSARDENRRALGALGVAEDGGPLELWTGERDRARVDELLGPRTAPLVALHPGSDWSCQQWLPERFGEVGGTLQRAGARIVITGSAAEAGLQEEVAGALHAEPVRAAGRTSLGELVALVRAVDLVVCVNSAASAIAEAVGTPSVVVMGPEDARHCGVEAGPLRRVLQPGGSLPPGSWCELGRWGVLSGCESPICRGLGGLSELESGEVSRAALELLMGGGRADGEPPQERSDWRRRAGA